MLLPLSGTEVAEAVMGVALKVRGAVEVIWRRRGACDAKVV
jgi:hypothetical protein